MTTPTVLLTGAAGYIASHTWLALWQAGFEVLGIDNFANSSPRVLERLARISGRDPAAVHALFERHSIAATVHFAALKAVGESVQMPLAYYANNIGGLVNVCEAMQRHGVKRFVFSSSATVYGDPQALPIREDAPLSATNPYGQSKLMGEQILRDLDAADATATEGGTKGPAWQTATLRYFNPVGAHDSGLIGEDPRGVPNNLMPFVAQVAVGRRDRLAVFGNDYATPDGTGVRDYIHVTDLAEGHVAALQRLFSKPGAFTVNLGTGRGYSVLEVVAAYAAASGRAVPYEVKPRRPGDVAACYADPALARELLGWRAQLGLPRMCEDSWRWQSMNPKGFEA
jgi:UDP-glucose 4-epimerase